MHPQSNRPEDSGRHSADVSGSSRPLRPLNRRKFLIGSSLAAGAIISGKALWDYSERFQRAATVVVKAPAYDSNLTDIIRRGMRELGIGRDWVRHKSVLLKPNLVEPSTEAPHINTHPALIRAAAEVFRRWNAREIIVAEGQGHVRDTNYVLEQSGLEPVLREAKVPFIDLNTDEVFEVENRLRFTDLQSLYLPQTLRRADVIVSLPKMKTHHLAGVTLSMKNLFGVMPGVCYGWPKNVLHYAGIGRSVLDITAAVGPHLAIVDGIVGMEGDGPIMGTPKRMGLLVIGTNLPAVDATAARLMRFDPTRIDYLSAASGRLGPIHAHNIEQRGESLEAQSQQFHLPEHPFFDRFRS